MVLFAAISCSERRVSERDLGEFNSKFISAIGDGDLDEIESFFLQQGEELSNGEHLFILAPSRNNSSLVESECLALAKAKKKWPEMTSLFDKAESSDSVLYIKWVSSRDGNSFTIMQFFIIRQVDGFYYAIIP